MRVAVLGAGQMGHGIAQVSAQAGHDVVLRDVAEDIVAAGLESIADTLQGAVDRDLLTDDERRATLDRITGTTDLSEAVADADLVVEAVPEDLELKTEVFRSVEHAAPDDAILASNISTWEEADEWCPSYGSLRELLDRNLERLPEGGVTAREDAVPILFVFDEASSHASGRGQDGYEAGQKLGPLVYKIRKARAGLIIIGHDGKDVHPAVRTQALVIQKFRGEVKRAEVYE
ncbi:MAG: 3-hydroxyacyl-CoA dehydrogenase family protein, partial [Halolamina sp.]